MEFSAKLYSFLTRFNLNVDQMAELFETDSQTIEAWLSQGVPSSFAGMADLALEYLENLYALEPGEKPKYLLKDASIGSKRRVVDKNLLSDKTSRSKSGSGNEKCCLRCGTLVLAHTKFCGRCGKIHEA